MAAVASRVAGFYTCLQDKPLFDYPPLLPPRISSLLTGGGDADGRGYLLAQDVRGGVHLGHVSEDARTKPKPVVRRSARTHTHKETRVRVVSYSHWDFFELGHVCIGWDHVAGASRGSQMGKSYRWAECRVTQTWRSC